MGTIKSFEDLTVWQNAIQLSVDVYKTFDPLKAFAFKDQIFRATVSISNNIAEGFERETKKEYVRFLYLAKGSCGEVRSMLYLAKSLDFITKEKCDSLVNESKIISSKLLRLIQALQRAM